MSLRACYQLIGCLLHHGRGPHTRRTDAMKQRTVAYLSERGQMFLQPGTDNPSYATASARQCKCAPFSVCLYIRNKKDHSSWHVRADIKFVDRPQCRPIIRPRPTAGLWISHTRGPVGDRVPSPRFDTWAMAPETWPLPAVLHAHPSATLTNCPVASDGAGGDSPACRLGADRPLCFSHRASPYHPPAVL